MPAISVTGSEEWLGELDVLALDGVDERRADLLERPHRQARPRRRGRAGRAVARRRVLPAAVPPGVQAQGHPHRRRGGDPPDRPGRHRAGAQAARRRRRSGRPLRVRVRGGARRLRDAGARVGPAPVHGDRVPERVAQRDRVERDGRLDRRRPVRRRRTRSARSSSTATTSASAGDPSGACPS